MPGGVQEEVQAGRAATGFCLLGVRDARERHNGLRQPWAVAVRAHRSPQDNACPRRPLPRPVHHLSSPSVESDEQGALILSFAQDVWVLRDRDLCPPRGGRNRRIPLRHGDVLVWGGQDRMRFHGISTLKADTHPMTGDRRINLTFRHTGLSPVTES